VWRSMANAAMDTWYHNWSMLWQTDLEGLFMHVKPSRISPETRLANRESNLAVMMSKSPCCFRSSASSLCWGSHLINLEGVRPGHKYRDRCDDVICISDRKVLEKITNTRWVYISSMKINHAHLLIGSFVTFHFHPSVQDWTQMYLSEIVRRREDCPRRT
jgi:hypothetical protein